MKLAIFDLDNTLLAGDSDYAWGQFMAEVGAVDRDEYEAHNRAFYEDYMAGTLDIDAFLKFSLAPLARHEPEQLQAWHEQFLTRVIDPMITPAAHRLVAHHRDKGHTLMIITATNAFVTRPIAERFEIEHLLATEPEMVDGRYTGNYLGTPTFQSGKIAALDEWLAAHSAMPETTWFYSDSRNDIPLLERVDNPFAVDPDPHLREHANRRGWPIISLRED